VIKERKREGKRKRGEEEKRERGKNNLSLYLE
jgi:hypothetical protein